MARPTSFNGVVAPYSAVGITPPATVVGIGNELATSLVAYWKLDETSGNRADSAGANTLTDTNTVTYATGIISNAAKFTKANSEKLTINDNAALSMGDIDFTISLWVYWAVEPSTTNTLQSLLCKGEAWDISRAYHIFYWNPANGDRIGFFVGNYTAGASLAAASLGAPAETTWYHVVAWHDSVANTINIQVNGGTVDSAGLTTGSCDDGDAFTLGCAGDKYYAEAYIDEVAIWKRVLTAQERQALYAAGAGWTHPFA
jgi:hypothetical protein